MKDLWLRVSQSSGRGLLGFHVTRIDPLVIDETEIFSGYVIDPCDVVVALEAHLRDWVREIREAEGAR